MVNQELLEANGNIQVLQRGKMALSLSGMIRSIILIAAISLLLTLFIGPMRSASAESPTFVRVVNASPDAECHQYLRGWKRDCAQFSIWDGDCVRYHSSGQSSLADGCHWQRTRSIVYERDGSL